MKPLIVGNPAIFAIESSITEAFESPGRRALGYFLIDVAGRFYGVRSPTATQLACSFDAVERRLERRGSHRWPFNTDVSAVEIVDAVRAAIYDESRQNDTFFGLSAAQFTDVGATHSRANRATLWRRQSATERMLTRPAPCAPTSS